MGFPTQWEHTDSFRLETRNNYLSPGQFYAAGVFFNIEVPEMRQVLSPSADISAVGGGGCQDRANAQSHLLLQG